MEPAETGRLYDAIVEQWDRDVLHSSYGLGFVRRAIKACARRGHALDVGCGTGGRIMRELAGAGFEVTGIDVSAGALELARGRHPSAQLLQQDICEWAPPRRYELVVAWDSTFHVPKSRQAGVVSKLCNALETGGVLLFTVGGIDGEITGEMHGHIFYYSSLADHEYLRLLNEAGCRCLLMERDQRPYHHLVIIADRPERRPDLPE